MLDRKKPVEILHIASFIGNTGDILSNEGLSKFFQNSKNGPFRITNLEIRNFYKNRPEGTRFSFDEVLENAFHKFDRVLIGGGGFLDYWVEDSITGTTIEISPHILRKYGNRLIISSVGAFPHRQVPYQNLQKFTNFLYELQDNNTALMFRNDGTLKHLKSQLDVSVTNGLREAGDHCYLLAGEFAVTSVPEKIKPYIAVNVSPDQLIMQSSLRGPIDPSNFYNSLAQSLYQTADALQADIKFVPHLPVDFSAISELCELMPDLFVRENVSVHVYSGKKDILNSIYDVYQNALLCVCGRLHANILSIILDRPTVSLGILDRVTSVSQQHPNSVLIKDLNSDFSDSLMKESINALAMPLDSGAAQIKYKIEDFLSPLMS